MLTAGIADARLSSTAHHSDRLCGLSSIGASGAV